MPTTYSGKINKKSEGGVCCGLFSTSMQPNYKKFNPVGAVLHLFVLPWVSFGKLSYHSRLLKFTTFGGFIKAKWFRVPKKPAMSDVWRDGNPDCYRESGSIRGNAESLAPCARALAFEMERIGIEHKPDWTLQNHGCKGRVSTCSVPYRHVAMGLKIWQGAWQHRFTLILCFLSHQGERKKEFINSVVPVIVGKKNLAFQLKKA